MLAIPVPSPRSPVASRPTWSAATWRSSARPFPPAARPRADEGEGVPDPAAGEAEGPVHLHGVLEKQFRRYYAEAAARSARPGDTLLQILESRLDNVIYRAGLAGPVATPAAVSHGHFEVNGVAVWTSPSYRVEQYDIITVRKQSARVVPVRTGPRHLR